MRKKLKWLLIILHLNATRRLRITVIINLISRTIGECKRKLSVHAFSPIHLGSDRRRWKIGEKKNDDVTKKGCRHVHSREGIVGAATSWCCFPTVTFPKCSDSGEPSQRTFERRSFLFRRNPFSSASLLPRLVFNLKHGKTRCHVLAGAF